MDLLTRQSLHGRGQHVLRALCQQVSPMSEWTLSTGVTLPVQQEVRQLSFTATNLGNIVQKKMSEL